ncbi:MAG: hypothetical protein ACTHJ9_00655 [Rhodanobacter sp.]
MSEIETHPMSELYAMWGAIGHRANDVALTKQPTFGMRTLRFEEYVKDPETGLKVILPDGKPAIRTVNIEFKD